MSVLVLIPPTAADQEARIRGRTMCPSPGSHQLAARHWWVISLFWASHFSYMRLLSRSTWIILITAIECAQYNVPATSHMFFLIITRDWKALPPLCKWGLSVSGKLSNFFHSRMKVAKAGLQSPGSFLCTPQSKIFVDASMSMVVYFSPTEKLE